MAGRLLLVAALALSACGTPATGTPDAGDGPPATFTEVYAAFFPVHTRAQCNYCHSNPPNQISNGMLSMGADQATAYAAIVGKASASSGCGGRTLVVPGHPEESLFLLKLTDPVPCGGGRMPLGGGQLSAAQLAQVRSWIAAGAKND